MIKRTKTFDLNYSFSAAHDGIQRRQPLQQPSILNGLNAPVPAMDRRPARSSGSGRGSHRKPEKTAEMLFRNLDVFPLEKMQASTFQESIQEASKEFVMLANKEMMDILLLDALNSLNGGPEIQPRGITRFRTPN